MPTYKQVFLRPGHYLVRGKKRHFSASLLRKYRDGTNRLIRAGMQIPILKQHAKLGSPEGAPVPAGKASALDCLGWLKGVTQRSDGSLVNELDVTDPEADAAIKNKSVKFTSPEFNDAYVDSDGREFGHVIRHVALTPAPRTQKQGEFIACAEEGGGEIFQFSEDDYLGRDEEEANVAFAEFEKLKEKTPPEEEGEAAPAKDQVDPPPEEFDDTPKADEQPTNDVETTPDEVAAAGPDVAGLVAQVVDRLGVILPEGTDPNSPEGFTLILTAVLNSTVAKEEANGGGGDVELEEEPSISGQFGEEDDPRLVAMSEEVAKLRQERDARETEISRGRLAATLADKTIPPALAAKLRGLATSSQFSDDGTPEPQFTIPQVVDLVKATIPRACQLSEDDTDEAEPENKEAHFSETGSPFSEDEPAAPVKSRAEAREIADEMEQSRYTSPRQESWTSDLAGTHPGTPAPAAGPAVVKRPRGRPRKN